MSGLSVLSSPFFLPVFVVHSVDHICEYDCELLFVFICGCDVTLIPLVPSLMESYGGCGGGIGMTSQNCLLLLTVGLLLSLLLVHSPESNSCASNDPELNTSDKI